MGGERILVVDDNAVNLKLARVLLASAGFEPRTASDAEAALALVSEFRPRLVLMDLRMPGVDGFELARRLKDDPATRDMVVVALTAHAMKGDEERVLAAGFDGYLTKPFDTRALPRTIAEHIARGARSRRAGGGEAEVGPGPRASREGRN